MFFDSFNELLAMGRHAPYVWSAYGISLSAIIIAHIAVRARHRRLKRTLDALKVTP